jgi:hypothetical protein
VPAAAAFKDDPERIEVGMIVAELDDVHPARLAYGRGRGTLSLVRLVQRKDVRQRLKDAHDAALERLTAASSPAPAE